MEVFRIVVGILLMTLCATAAEKKIRHSQLPPDVKKTVAIESKGASIRGFSEETEHGQTLYEVEMIVHHHSKDVLMNRRGEIVEVEEQIAIDSLPSTVLDGLRSKAGKGKLMKVESITKHDHLVAYEAQVVTGQKRSEIQVGPDGKPLDHEE